MARHHWDCKQCCDWSIQPSAIFFRHRLSCVVAGVNECLLESASIMWRYLKRTNDTGDDQNKEKQKEKQKEAVKERWKRYEKNRTDRKVKDSWFCGRPWLHHSDTNVLTCLFCIELATDKGELDRILSAKGTITHGFIRGSSNLKLSTIKDHEVTKFHNQAAAIHKAKTERIANDGVQVAQSQAGRPIIALCYFKFYFILCGEPPLLN